MIEKPLMIEPKGAVENVVIWLHGLGASQHDFEPVAQYLQMRSTPNTRYILPQAPSIPVTLNNGFVMPAWYDLVDLKHPRTVNVAELDQSANSIREIIEAEVAKGIPYEKIFVAGFSQGGAVVLHLAYVMGDLPLGGVLALSTYFPTWQNDFTLSDVQRNIPSIHLHGSLDDVVPMQYGQVAYEALLAQGIQAEWHEYSMRHEVSEVEIMQIGQWLQAHY